jgi:hypothetical protein
MRELGLGRVPGPAVAHHYWSLGKTRSGRARRSSQAAASGQDPGAGRGAHRTVQRASRVPGQHLSGRDRPADSADRATERPDEVAVEPFRSFCGLIGTIPGIGQRCAEVIVAETVRHRLNRILTGDWDVRSGPQLPERLGHL